MNTFPCIHDFELTMKMQTPKVSTIKLIFTKFVTLLFSLLFFLLPTAFGQGGGGGGSSSISLSPSGDRSICQGDSLKINVANLNSGDTYTFQWLRNDNIINGQTQSSLVVGQAGVYKVQVTKNGGQTETIGSLSLTINPKPFADFNFNPTSGCGKTTVYFTNNSHNGTPGQTSNLEYSWNFDNGKTSNKRTPDPVRFSPPAGSGSYTYNIRLITKNTQTNCSDTIIKPLSLGRGSEASLSSNADSIIFNGEYFITACTDLPNAEIIFRNTASVSNSEYFIDWGDNSPPYSSATFTSLPHIYSIGTYKLKLIAKGGSCNDTSFYNIFVGSNPSISVGSPGNTKICTGDSLTFPISGITNNPPGTVYKFIINDGRADTIVYKDNVPNAITIKFLKSSCGVLSDGINNSYKLDAIAENPCGFTPVTVKALYVSQKPTPDFSIIPASPICSGTTINFKNIGKAGETIIQTAALGNCSGGKFLWEISPATGWTKVSGDFGSDGASPGNINPWSNSASNDISVNFTTPGIYSVKLRMGSTQCGIVDTIKTICVNPTPAVNMTLNNVATNKISICANETVAAVSTTTNSPSCGAFVYAWTVSAVRISDCANFVLPTIPNPSGTSNNITFTAPGLYTVTLTVTAPGGCVTKIDQQVEVKDKPTVTFNPIFPSSICQGSSISPGCNTTCFATGATFNWSFPTANTTTSNLQNPSNIIFNTPGTPAVTLSVTNACGTTTLTPPFTVIAKPVVADISSPTPSAGLPADAVCVNGTLQLANSTAGGTWSSANTSIATVNPTTGLVTGISTGTATISYTVTQNNCATTVQKTITVNPIPAVTVSGLTSICAGQSTTLTASSALASDFSWSNSSTLDKSSGSQVKATPAGTTTYTVTGTIASTGCSSNSPVTVTVNSLPTIAITANKSTICEGTTATLTATAGLTTYTWTSSPSLTIPNTASVFVTPLSTTQFTVTGTDSKGCSNSANTTITVNPKPSITVNSPSTCLGTAVSLTASGADSYVWSNQPGLTAYTGATVSANPSSNTTYTVTGTQSATGCSNSANAVVTIKSLPSVSVNSPTICPGTSATLTATGASTYSWATSTTLSSTSGSPVTASPTQTTTYQVTGTDDASGCSKTVNSLVTVTAIPSISAAGTNPTSCNGKDGSILISGLTNGASYTVKYTYQGIEITSPVLTANINGITLTGLSSGVYSNIYVTFNGCNSLPVSSVSLSDPSAASAPNISISPQTTICSGQNVVLSIVSPISGGSYSWSGPNNYSATGTSVTISNIQSSGKYQVTVTKSSCVSAPGSIDVTVNPTPAPPTVSNVSYCQGATATSLSASFDAGNTLYWYTVSTGGTGSTTAPIPPTNTASTISYYVSQRTSSGCESTRSKIDVIVSPIPVISVQKNNPTTCNGTQGELIISQTTPGTTYTVYYSKDGIQVNKVQSADASGVIRITGLSKGVYADIYVTLGTCTSNTVAGPLTLSDPTVPDMPTIANVAAICSGQSLIISVSNPIVGAIYNWSGPSGYTNTGSSITISNAPVTAAGTYQVSVTNLSCVSSPASVTATINPTPVAPTVSNVPYCQGAVAIPLAASFDAANTLYWYTSQASGTGNTTAPTPSTANAGTTSYFVSQRSTLGCEGSRAKIDVIVSPIPQISAQKKNPTTCNGTEGEIVISQTTAGTLYTVYFTKNGISSSRTLTADASGLIKITGLSQGTYTDIYVTLGSCTSNILTGPFDLIDPPIPPKPILSSSSPFCSGTTLLINIANPTSNATYTWNGPNGFQFSSTTSSSLSRTLSTVAMTGNYRVTMTVANCVSESGDIDIVVNQTPVGPTVTTPVVYCQGETAVPLTATIAPGNTVNWYRDASGGTKLLSAPTPSTSTVGSVTYYVSQTSDQGCEGPRTPLVVTVNTTPFVTDKDLTFCSDAPITFVPAGVPSGTTYTWTLPVINPGSSLTGATSQSTAVASFTQNLKNITAQNATAVYVVSPKISACPGADFKINITIEPKPLIASETVSPICSGGSLNFVPASTGTNIIPSNTLYKWTIGSIVPAGSVTGAVAQTLPTSSISQVLTNLTNAPATVVYNVTPVSSNCSGEIFTVTVIVNPRPKIQDLNEVICSSETFNAIPPNSPPGSIVPSTTLYTWPTPVSSGTNAITGGAAQPTGSAVISQTLTNTTITQQTLTYLVTPTAGSCTGPDFKVVVTVNPQPSIAPKKDTICSDETFVIQPFDAPIGTKYTWNVKEILPAGSVSGSSDQSIPQSTVSQTLISRINTDAKVIYSVFPTSGSCGGSGFEVEVIVNPKPYISTLRDTICNGTNFDIIPQHTVGTNIIPANTTYTWTLQSSSPLGSITGGSSQSEQQVKISQTLFNSSDAPGSLNYKVTPLSGDNGNCTGQAFDVFVLVNPDSKAVYDPTDTIGCPPYLINASKVRLKQFTQRNGSYIWYVDGLLHGSGINLPDYTIQNEDDTITLKLVTNSLYGCKPDSILKKFITYKLPHPDFTLSDTVGCGPLQVSFSNNTPDASLFTYSWDFGNGVTSNLLNPQPVTFYSNPNYGDTTYLINLNVKSVCNIVSFTRSLRIKSRPKAIFAPVSTIGCSPFKVVFNNNSKGLGNTYFWDYGDGYKDTTLTLTSVTHTYYTNVRDTFYAKLFVLNDCGYDSAEYAIIVAPNTIKLDFVVNGDQKEGCVKHTVNFINVSSGASAFRWDFGDGNIKSTNKNLDTVTHTYLQPGVYDVVLFATNGCTDTVSTERITVFSLPNPDFSYSTMNNCIGDSIYFANKSSGADSYLWKLGDGKNVNFVNPGHRYLQRGSYNVRLIAYKTNAPGVVCSDSIDRVINIVDTIAITYKYSDSISNCIPFKVTFVNNYRDNLFAEWNFGDGNIKRGDSVVHVYNSTGNFNATLLVKSLGGCNYTASKPVSILSPSGSARVKSGYSCLGESLMFEALPFATDLIVWDFGDGIKIKTDKRIIYHVYTNPGIYIPTVTFLSKIGCAYSVPLRDTIRVDRIAGGFDYLQEQFCGYTKVDFKDTSRTYFGRSSVEWRFGDNNSGIGYANTYNYQSTNTYLVQSIVTGISGCKDTSFLNMPVFVRTIPAVQIGGDTISCSGSVMNLFAYAKSQDSITLSKWVTSSGSVFYGNSYSNTFVNTGSYQFNFISGTVYGCYDTTRVIANVYPTPVVKASADVLICRGSSISISATGADKYNWFPDDALSCNDCQAPIAKPLKSIFYTVKGTTKYGCFSYDTINVTVINDFKISVSKNDSICVGDSVLLLATGAKYYDWSPSSGLSAINIQNPVAKPLKTTQYRVVGYDEYGCFRDTAYVTVYVSEYPKVDLGPDQLLATGSLFTIFPKFTAGPIKTWSWTPDKDLSCTNCEKPTVRIRNQITYFAKAVNYFGCAGSDSITFKVFCENTQVYIPNAFTPDNDGLNDKFLVRASGIQIVKSFRIFNRWGELVFEKTNFQPNDPAFGWDGSIRGVINGPDVFVYTVEVLCDNGIPYFYKGNVSLLK